jgi:hypothetical protein
MNPKRFHYNNSPLAMACGQLNGSFANESTWSYEMDILTHGITGQKTLTGRTVGNPGEYSHISVPFLQIRNLEPADSTALGILKEWSALEDDLRTFLSGNSVVSQFDFLS